MGDPLASAMMGWLTGPTTCPSPSTTQVPSTPKILRLKQEFIKTFFFSCKHFITVLELCGDRVLPREGAPAV